MFQVGTLVNSIDELLSLNEEYELDTKIEYINKKRVTIKYVNLPFAFDIETSSFYSDGIHSYTNEYVKEQVNRLKDDNLSKEEKIAISSFIASVDKHALMYIWQIGINGNAIVGRTWEEFDIALKKIVNHFNLNYYQRAIMFVHNLSYEMQWIRKRIEWNMIFAREERKALKALSTNGLEFRCSYMLSGLSLEKTCENLIKYKVEKKVGDLDYKLIRTPETPINETEMGYCVNDVIGLNAYIQEQIEMYKGITKIPLTNTGRVRLKCREHCFNDKNGRKYRQLMKRLRIGSIEEYKSLKRAFQGGFTHASCKKAKRVWNNVKSWDFTSSYPTVMVSEMYPMSSATHYDIMTLEEMEEMSETKLMIFDLKFTGLFEKVDFEHYLSESKCWDLKSTNTDNGRVISSIGLRTTMTNIDWRIFKQMYTWDSVEISNIYVYEKAYLPTPLVEVILDLYSDKTTLKDVEGKESEYMNSKGMLNSCYGMTVTDIITEIVNYMDDEWSSDAGDQQSQLDNYNKSSKRFLYYPWGVFVTAYARRNLFYGILEFKDDYIYSDTDSIKVLNTANHMDFINKYNEWVIGRLTKACEYHKINIEKIKPLTIKGKEKPLGVWDDDGDYSRFKTLGSKRYLVEYWKTKDGDGNPLETPHYALKCTIAGVNKKLTSKWFEKDYDKAFDKFDDLMTVPEESSGRLISAYGDEEISGCVTDYLGNSYDYNEKSYIHMEGSEYNLTMSPLYLALVNGKMEQSTEVDV